MMCVARALLLALVLAMLPGHPAVNEGRAVAAGCHPPSGSLTVADWQFPDTLNPYQTGRLVTHQADNLIFEDLFRYDGQGRVVPRLADAIPTPGNGGVRDGGRTIVLHLRRGMRWSNNAEITSADVRFGWQVGMDRATGPACLGTCDLIRAIDTPSRYVAVLRLRHADSSAVPAAMPDLWPPSWPHAWHRNAHVAAVILARDTSFSFHSARYPTSGPYQVSSFAAGKQIVLHAMPHYALTRCSARAATLTLVDTPSKDDLINAAAKHRADVALDLDTPDLAQLGKHPHAYSVTVHTSFTFEHLEFNLDRRYRGKPNPLADVRVRQALALALDRGTLVKNTLNLSPAHAAQFEAWSPYVHAPDLHQPLVPAAPAGQWDPIARAFVTPGTKRSLQHARILLARTPYKSGFALDFYTTTGTPFRETQEAALADSWSKLKVKVSPSYVPAAKLLGGWSQGGILSRGRFQIAMLAYLGTPDPQQYRDNLDSHHCDRRARVHSTLNGNGACVQNVAIDRAFAAAAATYDAAARGRAYATIQRVLSQQAYWVPLFFRPLVTTADRRIIGFDPGHIQFNATWSAATWRAG